MSDWTVYTISDGAEVVYVGNTSNLRRRIQSHRGLSAWFDPSMTISAVGAFDSPADAGSLELALIQSRTPRFNKAGITAPYARPGLTKARVGPSNTDQHLTAPEAAAAFGASLRTVRRWIALGKVDTIKPTPGRKILVVVPADTKAA